MQIPTRLMTVDEFWTEYAGQSYELVNGIVIEMMTSGYASSAVALRFALRLEMYLEDNPIGRLTGADGTYRLSEHDIRVPDVGYFSNAKAELINDKYKFLPFPPDLAVEVVSPTDRASEIREKVKLYLDSGTLLIWVVYPSTREVIVYTPDSQPQVLSESDLLNGGLILPNFEVSLTTIFAVLD